VRHVSSDRLNSVLKGVSRSFYLSLTVLPHTIRRPVGLAYLFARAADTIADTALISPSERLTHLERLRGLFRQYDATVLSSLRAALLGPQENPAERELLAALEHCFAAYHACDRADQARISRLLLTLTQGMVMDLTTFPQEHEGRVVALKTRADLERYTYYVAGCVGEFWTDIHMAHRPSLAAWDAELMTQRGIRFGKGLQLTNIVRDLPRDLRLGRCYLPHEDLARCGLEPMDLLDASSMAKLRPLLRELLSVTVDHYREGWAYTLAIPRREVRLRLACAWPLLIGCRTLSLIAATPNLLDPASIVKIPRAAVYRILFLSGLLAGSNWGLGRYARRLSPRSLKASRDTARPLAL
jgi:farnesyl-diphosphate farnesyltransferase